MAHIARSIELEAAVDAVHEQWLRYEALPRSAIHAMVGRVRWRAEVLTIEPTDAGSRLTLKLEFDPASADPGLADRVEAALLGFTAFIGRVGLGALDALPA